MSDQRANSPVMLSIELSQRDGGVALRDARGEVHIEPVSERRRHDDELMPAVDRLCRRAGIDPDQLQAVAVSIGPGGFTGLRIAVTTAKVLALSLGATLIGVPSADVAVEPVDRADAGTGDVLVALAAKRETFWATRFRWIDGHWSSIDRGALVDAAEVPFTSVAALIADEYLPARAAERAVEAGVRRLPLVLEASACLRVGLRRLAASAGNDAHRLTPLYPRQPEAVTVWERRHEG